MEQFKFKVHYVHDPYDGSLVYPDSIDLCVGYNVIAKLPIEDLVIAVEQYNKYMKTIQI